MTKKEAEMQASIEQLVASRFRLQIEMLERINAALVEDNNKLGARVAELERDQYLSLGRTPSP